MNWSYLYKHWLSTLLLGPIISLAAMYEYGFDINKIVGFLEIFPPFLLLGFLFSIPTYLFYGFLYYYFAKKNIKPLYAKLILIPIAVIGVITTALLIKGTMMTDIALSYSISSVLTGCFFKLNFKTPENKK